MTISENEDQQATREKILHYLLLHRASPDAVKYCTANELARSLNISANGVRHHLKQLEYEQLITRTVRRGKTGRPATIYTFKDKAFNQFPKLYVEVSKMLLEMIIRRFGSDVAVEILEDIGEKILDDLKGSPNYNLGEQDSDASLDQKVAMLKQIFEDYGKMPEISEEKDWYVIKNYNCLVYELAVEYPLVCKIDEFVIRELIGFQPIKEGCIRDGDSSCQFRIKKEPKKPAV